MEKEPIATIYEVREGKCSMTRKEAEGVVVTIPNSPIINRFLSKRKLWEVLQLYGVKPKENE